MGVRMFFDLEPPNWRNLPRRFIRILICLLVLLWHACVDTYTWYGTAYQPAYYYCCCTHLSTSSYTPGSRGLRPQEAKQGSWHPVRDQERANGGKPYYVRAQHGYNGSRNVERSE